MIARIPEQFFSSDVAASLVLLSVLVLARFLFGRALKDRDNLPPQVVRRWTANMRNVLLLVAIVGLVMIWAPQLRTFALSLTAVAVAVVVATKELILCLSGSALRTFTRAYSVGDHVEIGTTRGEVLDYNLLATTLREFADREGSYVYTGREVLVPHSLLFASPTRVAAEVGERVRHRFDMVFEPGPNLFAKREEIVAIACDALQQFEADENKALTGGKSKGRGSSRPPSPEVEIGLGTTDIGKYRLAVAAMVLPELAARSENAIACAIGNRVHALAVQAAEAEGANRAAEG